LKIKEPGRPPASPNKKSNYVRDERLSLRVTEGFNKTVELLKESGNYTSAGDVIHEAVRHFALSRNPDKTILFWINQIL
jgi:Arc/MetJ-type ribon-helix-helix transcriptional regulator